MKYLVLTPHYEPDLGPGAPLYTMLSKELVRRGHEVTVITTVPHYPTGQVPIQYRKKMIHTNMEAGIQVHRVRLPSMDRANLLKRTLQFISYQIGASIALIGKKYDMVVVTNPAIWVFLPFVFSTIFRKIPSIFSVYDLYPDVGITLGIFRHQFVINIVTWLEKICLSRATYVSMISHSFKHALRRLGVSEEKMVLLYVWVDTELIKPLPKTNSFSQDHHFTDKFVVLYAGNIGLSQGLENVLSAAVQLSDHDDIQFVFVGEGAAREELVAHAREKKLMNVEFFPFQPREKVAEVLSSADISLVVLKKGVGASALPSKIYSTFASGRPIIASVDEGSETWDLILESNAGICVAPENPTELTKAILQLKENQTLREEMGKNGRKRAEEFHSPYAAADCVERLASKTLNPG